MTLWDAAGTTQITTDASGATINPIVTTSSGAYLFSNLLPGQYTVKFEHPGGLPADPGQRQRQHGGQRQQRRERPERGVGQRRQRPHPRQRLRPAGEPRLLRLGDANNNGLQDSGETAISGASVALLDSGGAAATDINGVAVPVQTTGANGQYYFSNLAAGSYYVQVTPPAGYVPSRTQSAGAI